VVDRFTRRKNEEILGLAIGIATRMPKFMAGLLNIVKKLKIK
jgi:hypothetical protein